MNESGQTTAAVKREVQLSEWQRQIQERQEEGVTVDEWCMSMGISKGAYYHRLRKVLEYMCPGMAGTKEEGAGETMQSAAIVPVRVAQPGEKATIEMQLGELQIRFNKSPDTEQLKIVLNSLMGANKPVC